MDIEQKLRELTLIERDGQQFLSVNQVGKLLGEVKGSDRPLGANRVRVFIRKGRLAAVTNPVYGFYEVEVGEFLRFVQEDFSQSKPGNPEWRNGAGASRKKPVRSAAEIPVEGVERNPDLSLIEIVKQGKEAELSGYDALNLHGYIKDPVKEFL